MTAERYVQAFRRAIEVPADSRERNLEAIERRLAAREVDDDEPVRAPVEPRGRWAAALFMFKAVSISVGLGVAGLGAVKVGAMAWSAATSEDTRPAAHEEAPQPAARAPARDRIATPPRAEPPRVETPAVEPPPSPPEPAAIAEPPASPAEPSSRSAARARAPLPRAKAPVADRLREEVDLLERARAQLDAGRHEAALALLGEHEQRFPDGAMIEERRAWRAIASCSLLRPDAPAEAKAFLARHPRSSLAEKVRRACADRRTDPARRSD